MHQKSSFCALSSHLRPSSSPWQMAGRFSAAFWFAFYRPVRNNTAGRRNATLVKQYSQQPKGWHRGIYARHSLRASTDKTLATVAQLAVPTACRKRGPFQRPLSRSRMPRAKQSSGMKWRPRRDRPHSYRVWAACAHSLGNTRARNAAVYPYSVMNPAAE